MSVNEQHFDRVVTGFFRAATGAIPWEDALLAVQTAFRARTAVLQTIDTQTGRVAALSAGGPSIHECRLQYLRRYVDIDPRRRHLLTTDLSSHRWWHDHETYDEQFVATDRYYQEFLPAFDIRFQSTVMLQPAPGLVAGFALELPVSRGPLDADERQLAERLGRHLDEALRAHERVRRMAAQALAGHVLLDAFSYPMWLVDADRFIFHANATAREQGEIVSDLADDQARRLTLRSDRADGLLGMHLHAMTGGRHGMRASIDTRRLRSDPPSWLHLNAIEPQRVLGAFGDRPLVLATLFDPRQMRELDPFALGDLFGMTPTQARVAALLAEGLTAEAIGAKLGCSVPTVRTHLRRVMARLGATRLADAVRLLRQGEALWAMPIGSTAP